MNVKTKTASRKMKLIPLTILLTSLAVDVNAQKFRQDHYSFPPQFQTPNAAIFSSDSSMYLPPESHTALPYFPMKNMNNLQYPLLPPTGTKAPSMFPTPFPFVFSTTLVPNFDDDDDHEDNGRIRLSSSPPPPTPQKMNQTEKRSEQHPKEKREMRTIPNNMFQQPIQNRNDIKFPFKVPNPPPVNTTPNPSNPTANRRMIISAENQRSDVGLDQIKAASFNSPPFIPVGQGIYVSSTVEPKIPILRLSNEMDLDGSFSYEALGADQTHYVQHSRMENLGPESQEQVVEGSYSYVGDDGKTYTVHYIADSNGFRASGDHLPVAPPIPEIIQRAVQYNLAEEAKKPPHLRHWQDDGRDNDINESDKNQNFAPPPTRNLFTGRTPEAFSYSYSQGSNTGNNLVTAASNQVPVKTVEYTTEQPKVKPNNNGPISPQITFLASQGAHVPSANTIIQDTISRMFTTEKSTMPQLVNYEAGVKEADQDPNKGLWRWQYGMNANNLNQQPNKNTISRSSGEGDDIIINFGNMSPDEYAKMIRSQLEDSENIAGNQYTQNFQTNENQNNYLTNYYQSQEVNKEQPNNEHGMLNEKKVQENKEINQYQGYLESQISNQYQNQQTNNANDYQKQSINNYQILNNPNDNTIKYPNSYASPSTAYPQNEEWLKPTNNIQQNYEIYTTRKPVENHFQEQYQYQSTNLPIESRKLVSDTPKILTQKDFIFPTQTITQSYNFEDMSYEPRKLKAIKTDTAKTITQNLQNQVQNTYEKSEYSDIWAKTEQEVKETTTQEPYISSVSNFKFTDFIVQEHKSDFKPIVTTTSTEAPRVIETTTESILEDILNNNIFLKNLISPEKTERNNDNSLISPEKSEKQQDHYLMNPEKPDKQVENYPARSETQHELHQVNFEKPERKDESNFDEDPEKLVHTKIEAEPKTDKVPKVIQYHAKPPNDLKSFKKKPVDIAEILNYVSMKNHFESSKVKTTKNKPVGNNFDHRSEVRFIPIQQDRDEKENRIPEQKNSFRTLNQDQQEEFRGLIKNYKVLQRNNNNIKYDSGPLKRELSPPPLKSPNLPPLGRAGPSMKSYLPPIYV